MDDVPTNIGTDVRVQRSGGVQASRGYPPSADAPAVAQETRSYDVSSWTKLGQTFLGVGAVHDALPPGMYACEMTPRGPAFAQRSVAIDNLFMLPDSADEMVVAEFESFWGLRDEFVKRGFLHKRGYFFWGPPGGGKTSAVQLMAASIVREHRGVVALVNDPAVAAACLQLLRLIEPDRPIVAVLEDLDALIERHGENEFLALLDGEAQVERIVFVATSNYPERLDKRFLDRPSRFDTIKFVGMPTAAARRMYLERKEPTLTGEELNRWVEATEGYSVAHLRELVIAVKVFGQSVDDVIGRLDKMRARQPKSDDHGERKIGFGA